MYFIIFSVHVRRRDKLNYGSVKHEVEEYMNYAEAYFKRLEDRGRSVTRRIYLATDDARVINEFKEK